MNELTPRPVGLVVELACQLTPVHATDGFGQMPVLDHILHRVAFKTDHLVLVDDLTGEFMKMFKPCVGDFGVALGHLLLRFGAIIRAFLLATETPLRSRQRALVACRVAWSIDLGAITGHGQVFYQDQSPLS